MFLRRQVSGNSFRKQVNVKERVNEIVRGHSPVKIIREPNYEFTTSSFWMHCSDREFIRGDSAQLFFDLFKDSDFLYSICNIYTSKSVLLRYPYTSRLSNEYTQYVHTLNTPGGLLKISKKLKCSLGIKGKENTLKHFTQQQV